MAKLKKLNLKNIKVAPYLMGGVVSVICALLLILAFALLIRFAGVPNAAIKPVNILIKILSIGAGVFVATKDGTKGLKKGITVGVVFIVLSFFVFAILARSISFSWLILADLALGAIVGAIFGVLCVNLRK